MKALSLWQPWASAIALGLKKIETRHWATSHRGLLAIHAAKRWDADQREFTEEMRAAKQFPLDTLAFGAVIAVVTLVEIRRSEQLVDFISDEEARWGNYGPRRYGWMMADVLRLPEPYPFRGHQTLFDLPDDFTDVMAAVARAIDADSPPS